MKRETLPNSNQPSKQEGIVFILYFEPIRGKRERKERQARKRRERTGRDRKRERKACRDACK